MKRWPGPAQQPAPLDEATIPCDEPTPGQHKSVEALQQLSPDAQQAEPQHDPLQHVPFVQQFCPAEQYTRFMLAAFPTFARRPYLSSPFLPNTRDWWRSRR